MPLNVNAVWQLVSIIYLVPFHFFHTQADFQLPVLETLFPRASFAPYASGRLEMPGPNHIFCEWADKPNSFTPQARWP